MKSVTYTVELTKPEHNATVEDIILTMAEIVLENRELREKIAYLEESDRWYRHNLADMCEMSMQETKNLIGGLLV